MSGIRPGGGLIKPPEAFGTGLNFHFLTGRYGIVIRTPVSVQLLPAQVGASRR